MASLLANKRPSKQNKQKNTRFTRQWMSSIFEVNKLNK